MTAHAHAPRRGRGPAPVHLAHDERGLALVLVLMALVLLLALGSALVLQTMTETQVRARHRAAVEVLSAAEAGLVRAILDLTDTADWTHLPAGATHSTFTDGPPAGTRDLTPGGDAIELGTLTHLVRCGRPDGCTDGEMRQVTGDRPWGVNNPRWQLYAWGPLSSLLPDTPLPIAAYLVVWVGDDPSETDNDPLQDGGPAVEVGVSNPGAGALSVLAHAYGAHGAHRSVEAIVRRERGSVRVERWLETAR